VSYSHLHRSGVLVYETFTKKVIFSVQGHTLSQ
jgi:hypothetical protein